MLPFENNAAINVEVEMIFPLSVHVEAPWMSIMVVLFLFSLGTSVLFALVAAAVCMLASSVHGFAFPHRDATFIKVLRYTTQ